MATTIRHRSADGGTILTLEDLGTLVSTAVEVDSARIKLCAENIATRALGIAPFNGLFMRVEQIGTNDGFTFGFTALDTNGTLSKPWGLAVDASNNPTGGPTVVDGGAGGVWGATGNYGVTVTAVNGAGETIGSVETVFNVGDTTRKQTYTWVATPGAAGYKVYRTNVPGTYGGTSLRTTINNGATVTFTDDGSALVAGTPPTVNTTGGAGPTYGTPPLITAFDQTDKTMALAPNGMAVGQQFFYWHVLKIGPGTSSVGNKRSFRLIPREL